MCVGLFLKLLRSPTGGSPTCRLGRSLSHVGPGRSASRVGGSEQRRPCGAVDPSVGTRASDQRLRGVPVTPSDSSSQEEFSAPDSPRIQQDLLQESPGGSSVADSGSPVLPNRLQQHIERPAPPPPAPAHTRSRSGIPKPKIYKDGCVRWGSFVQQVNRKVLVKLLVNPGGKKQWMKSMSP